MTTSRREFLRSVSTSAAIAGLGTSGITTAAFAADDKSFDQSQLPVIDTHQHLWDLSKVTLPWLSGESVKDINRNFVSSDYIAHTRGANVVKAVYMEVNVQKSDQQKEAEYVIDLCERDDNPTVAAVIGGYPFAEDFRDYITPLSKNKYIKGVRTVLQDPDRKKGLCLEKRFVENVKLLGDLGLSFDLCMRANEISDGVALAKKCPNTKFIIDHCGNMSVVDNSLRSEWKDGMKAAAQQDNMLCKISGIVVTANKGTWKPADLAPNMNFCMDIFGEDRIIFGGDWPVCTLKSTFVQWVDALKWIVKDRSPEFQNKLFHRNAARQYGLGTTA